MTPEYGQGKNREKPGKTGENQCLKKIVDRIYEIKVENSQ